MLATPASAGCVVAGNSTTCTLQNPTGIAAETPDVIVDNITADISAPHGTPAIDLTNLSNAYIDLGQYTLRASGNAAALIGSPGDATIDFTGNISVTGANTPGQGNWGIAAFFYGSDPHEISLRYAGDLAVDVDHDPAIGVAPFGGISVNAGPGTANLDTSGNINVAVAGEPSFVAGVMVMGQAGTTVTNNGNVHVTAADPSAVWGIVGIASGAGSTTLTNNGNVTVTTDSGIGSALNATSNATSTVISVGDLDIDLGEGIGPGIAATGMRNFVDSRGNISATGSGIAARGPSTFDDEILIFGTAELVDVVSVGNITTKSVIGTPAILALADEVLVSSTGSLSTNTDFSGGIVATRYFGLDDDTGEAVYDYRATSVSVTNDGNITTLGKSAAGIAAGATGGTVSVDSRGTITTSGQFSDGIFATGGGVTIASEGDITANDGYALRATGGVRGVEIATGEGTHTQGTTGIGVTSAGKARIANHGKVTGTGPAAIYVTATGNIDITSNETESTGNGSYGIAVNSANGKVNLNSASVILSGDTPPATIDNLNDFAAIRVIAYNGEVNARIGDIQAEAENGRGILVWGQSAKVVVDGHVAAEALGVSALTTTGLSHVLINGSVDVNSGGGIQLGGGPQGLLEVADGASVSGGLVGVDFFPLNSGGGFLELHNDGLVEAKQGPAVRLNPFALGASDVYIRNNGTLRGSAGLAVETGAGSDVLELTERSIIEGMVDLGVGEDRLVLDFNDDAANDAVGQVAATRNVERLAVESGNWRADGVQSAYAYVGIEAGATLTIAGNAEGEAAVTTPYVELDGRLNLQLGNIAGADYLTGLVLEGAGSLHLSGPATMAVDDASGLLHTGGTFVENGELLLTAVYGGDITTSGAGVFRLGEGGDFTGDLVNDGTFIYSRAGDYSVLGDFSGSGLLEKNGNGKLTFAGLYAFTGTTTVLGGSVAFTGHLAEDTRLDLGGGTIDLSQVEGGQQTIAQLSGEGGTLQLGQTQLVVDQSGDTVFSGVMTGTGSLIKDGEGDLKLNGDGTGFTGTGQVDGGTLSVNGDFSNASFVVNEGGTLGGAGTIGNTQVAGGTLAPGNSIDTLTVAGDISFNAASVFEVEVTVAGSADLLQATGTATLGGASVNVIAQSGLYAPATDYTILTADGGVTGTFGAVDTNLAFLDPSLVYSANSVTLRLLRNDVDFSALGGTANEIAVGNLLESLGFGNVLYDETLTLIQDDVAPSFASLTGEVYPAYGAAILETAEMLRRQTRETMTGEGGYVWATGLYNSVGSNGPGNIELAGHGVAGGFGFGGNGLSVSAGLGILDQNKGGGDFTQGKVTFAIGQVAYNGASGLLASAGVQFGWVNGEIRRQTLLGRTGGAVMGDIDGDYLQLSGEISYRVPLGSLSVEPLVGISHVSLKLDALTETGASTALTVAAIDRDVTFGKVGLRLSGNAESGIRPFASAAYRHTWGDRASLATVGFAGMAGTALIGANDIARSGAELSTGLALTYGAVHFQLGYNGMISKGLESHGLNAGLKVRF